MLLVVRWLGLERWRGIKLWLLWGYRRGLGRKGGGEHSGIRGCHLIEMGCAGWKNLLVWHSDLSLGKLLIVQRWQLSRKRLRCMMILFSWILRNNTANFHTKPFFKAAYRLFDSDFYVKADDDIYLRPDRLSLLLAKERADPRTYLGCMKKGLVFTDPKIKWYEPLSNLLGSEYFLHAYGPLYALSAEVVASLVAFRNESFRMFSNEDVTIGAWMLAMNVNHEYNKALCEPQCTSTSIAVWDIPKCSGLCKPEEKLVELHQTEICSKSPTSTND